MQDLEKLKASILRTPYKDENLHPYEDCPQLIQLAIAERLDRILTVLEDITSPTGKANTRLKIWNKQS